MLFISDKILLSHESIKGLHWCLNIHRHDNNKNNGDRTDQFHYNVCKLSTIKSKQGGLANIQSIHRLIIENVKENPIHG